MTSPRHPRPTLLLLPVAALVASAFWFLTLAGETSTPGSDGDATADGSERACALAERVPEVPLRMLCRGVWVRGAGARFVPQGLALAPDRTAYVSGYRWRDDLGHPACQVVQVDRRSGRLLARLPLLRGAVGARDDVTCRHGGGLALTRDGLWLAETSRLWLLDPGAIARGEQAVLRVWGLERPIMGSTVVASEGRLGFGGFHRARRRYIHWIPVADLLRPGVLDGSVRSADDRTATVVATQRAPARLQGLASGPGGIWATRSTTFCGALHTPGSGLRAFVPGAEGIDFDGTGAIWAVSESGSGPYQRRGGRLAVPTLVRVRPELLDPVPADTCRRPTAG